MDCATGRTLSFLSVVLSWEALKTMTYLNLLYNNVYSGDEDEYDADKDDEDDEDDDSGDDLAWSATYCHKDRVPDLA